MIARFAIADAERTTSRDRFAGALPNAPRVDARALLDVLPGAHLLLDPERRIACANGAARERLGIDPVGAYWERRDGASERSLPDGTLVTLDSEPSADQSLTTPSSCASSSALSALSSAQAALAHQIRSPLTAAGLTVDHLLLTIADAAEHARLERIRDSLRSIEQHVRNALVFVRGELSERHEFSVASLVQAMREAWADLLPTERGHWREDFASHDRLCGDRSALVSALTNVVENARTIGGAHVRIDVAIESDEHVLSIAIADDGPGMRRSVLERVRARARERGAQPLVSERRGGTGLGLPIADAVVRAHGGVLEIDSIEGCGTRVCVVLPLAGASA